MEKSTANKSTGFITLSYRENCFATLEGMVRDGTTYDGILVDLMQVGFSLSMEQLSKFISYAKKLLNPRGVMLFVKADGAMTLARDDYGGGLSIDVYDSPYSALMSNPMLVPHACDTVPGIDKKRLTDAGSTLS